MFVGFSRFIIAKPAGMCRITHNVYNPTAKFRPWFYCTKSSTSELDCASHEEWQENNSSAILWCHLITSLQEPVLVCWGHVRSWPLNSCSAGAIRSLLNPSRGKFGCVCTVRASCTPTVHFHYECDLIWERCCNWSLVKWKAFAFSFSWEILGLSRDDVVLFLMC